MVEEVAAHAAAVGEGAVEAVVVKDEEGTTSGGRPNLSEPCFS